MFFRLYCLMDHPGKIHVPGTQKIRKHHRRVKSENLAHRLYFHLCGCGRRNTFQGSTTATLGNLDHSSILCGSSWLSEPVRLATNGVWHLFNRGNHWIRIYV